MGLRMRARQRRWLAATAGTGLLMSTLACSPQPHVYVAEPMAGTWRIAVLPLANYTSNRDAADRVLPILSVELARKPGVVVVDPGAVDAALAKEPWLMLDRLPLDLVQSIGAELNANALMVGALTGYSSRQFEGEMIPQISLSLRLLEVPSGRVMWNAVHSRDGSDSETVFGFGRVQSAEQMAAIAVREVLETFPTSGGAK